MEIWFVYCHYKSTGEIFYVGISKRRVGNTPYQIYKRAYESYWKKLFMEEGLLQI